MSATPNNIRAGFIAIGRPASPPRARELGQRRELAGGSGVRSIRCMMRAAQGHGPIRVRSVDELDVVAGAHFAGFEDARGTSRCDPSRSHVPTSLVDASVDRASSTVGGADCTRPARHRCGTGRRCTRSTRRAR